MKKVILAGLFIAIVLAVFLSPFASQRPDGLERVAEDKGFLLKGEGREVFSAPIPDYTMPFVKRDSVATSLAGLIGTLITFFLAYGMGNLIRNKRKT